MSTQWSAAVPTGRYQSKAEAKMAAHLDLLKAAGEIAGWRYVGDGAGVLLHAGPHGEVVGHYTYDFEVDVDDAIGTVAVEVKGRVSRDFPLRRRCFEACYPLVTLHVVPSDEVENYDPRTWRNGRRRRTR